MLIRKTKSQLRKLTPLQLVAERQKAQAIIDIMVDYQNKIQDIFNERQEKYYKDNPEELN